MAVVQVVGRLACKGFFKSCVVFVPESIWVRIVVCKRAHLSNKCLFVAQGI